MGGVLPTVHTGAGKNVSRKVLAVLVDGTWHEAKRMHKCLETLPHISLTSCNRSELLWRKQSMEGRVSTVEAAACLLEELGEAPEVSAALRSALAVLSEALEKQAHYSKSQ